MGKGKGRRLVRNTIPYISRAMCRKVGREKSVSGPELEEPK